MVYGTPFEKLEDEEKTAVTKKPKGIQDEIVTDEKGRRRFHGAFTGGFSAGYFNTVGTKHGWVPQTFKSSREDRADRPGQSTAEDYMDEEDLGEFGIAARKLRPKVDFMDSLMTAAPGEKHLLAWERSTTTVSTSSAVEDDGSLAHKLTGILRPISDSIGVRMMKKMGWKPGKGVGQKMTRRALERQKVIDARTSGKIAEFDEQTVQEVEEFVHGAEFSPDDVSMFEIKPKEDVHGLGYKPLKDSGVLSQKYGTVTSALKTSKRSKGIRGQAFGVGAFEEDDEEIYTNYDLSQYDFEVGASTSLGQHDVPKFDSTFVPASVSSKPSRKYFSAPMPPPGWRPNPNRTKSLLERKAPPKLSENLAKAADRLTPFQRAKLLGEQDHSVMEMLSTAEREKLKQIRQRKDGERRRDEGRIRGRQNEAEYFEEEPMKAHRFKQYVAYLKRGIPFPQPVDMTRLEWEKEQAEFQEALTPELRALLPEVRDRLKPLAKIDYAAPIAEHLKARFQQETGVQIKHEPGATKDPKLEAVQAKKFGTATRQKHEWHPAKELCKRFNVPNPYPESQIIGAPGLSRMSQRDYDAEYSLFDLGGGLSDTAMELNKRTHQSRFDQQPTGKVEIEELKQEQVKKEPQEDVQTTADSRVVPIDFLAAIFGEEEDTDEEKEPSEDEDVDDKPLIRLPKRKPQSAIEEIPVEKTKEEAIGTTTKRTITVFDLVEDLDVYGPTMPTEEFLAKEHNGSTNGNGIPHVVTVEDESEESSSSEDEEKKERGKKKAKRKKEKKRSKKHHHKTKKGKRKRRKSESD